MKTVIVIQARTGSSRLPNKVLLPLAGAPLLQRFIERVQQARSAQHIVVATTTESVDDPIRDLCKNINVPCYSGHPTDLLDRHYQAALHEQADVVVKIPSDCPLIDPAVIDRVIQFFHSRLRPFDFVSNLHPATYPDGNDVELMTMDAMKTAWQEATKNFEREHTTPFLWEQPHRFQLGNVMWETGLNYSMSHRWTIDYPEDYQFIKSIYNELWTPSRPIFSLNEILNLLKSKPKLHAINAKYAGINWYRNHIHELRTITQHDTRQLIEQ